MIDFGELRSAVENCRYEDIVGTVGVLLTGMPDQYHHWMLAKMSWMKPHTFGLLCKAIVDVRQGPRKRIASVVYLILAGGHREHWMRYAMACLRGVEHETTNAADLVWWMCSHAPDLHERILDAGHTCGEDLVWEFLAQFAYWELVRPETFGGYESPGCTGYDANGEAALASWPCSKCIAISDDLNREDWGIYVRTRGGAHIDDLDGSGRSSWRVKSSNVINTTRKAMEGDA